MPTQSTKFSSSVKEGRGDTSAWTDTPSDRAQKAKMEYVFIVGFRSLYSVMYMTFNPFYSHGSYLEAYNETASLASNEEDKKKKSLDADLVDKYNKEKRAKSLVQKHQETASRPKKKSKQQTEKEEWVGKHPWKPWDREKDLTGGRQSVKLDSENMAQGLTSRFSAGSYQRNFL